MKRKALNILLAAGILLMTGCAKEDTGFPELLSVADGKAGTSNLPEGVKVVENPEEFQAVQEDQSYHADTDQWYLMKNTCTPGDGVIYVNINDNIGVLDKETKAYTCLCSTPGCLHDSYECNAYAERTIQYYDGYLYTYRTESVFEGDINVGKKLLLYRIAPDGSSADGVCEFATVYYDDMVDSVEGMEGYSDNFLWMIHRGYVYYAYDIGTAAVKDDSYYNNMSHYVCRMKLDGTGEREYLMPLEGSAIEQISFHGCGSYVYFLDVGEGDKGTLYRFNTEACEIEKMPLTDVEVETYTMVDEYLYYTIMGDTTLYRYDFNGCKSEEIMDFQTYDERFGSLPGGARITNDGEYIWATSWVDEEDGITGCMILDFDGNYVSGFDIGAEGDYNVGMRAESDLVLIVTYGDHGWYWFDREEIKTGDIHPVEIENLRSFN